MKKIFNRFVLVIAIYTIALLSIEFSSSSEIAKNICSRMNGSITFYGVNTTICYFLLWASSLILLLCIYHNSISKQEKIFYWSQIFLFFLLGIAERFLGYEKASQIFDIHPLFLVISLLALEGFLLMVFLPDNFSYDAKICLHRAFFTVLFMLVLDGIYEFARNYIPVNLILPHLCKTWTCTYLFLFSWNILESKIQIPKSNGHRLTNQIVAKRTLREREEIR